MQTATNPQSTTPPQQKPVDGLKRIRTYERDVEELMQKREVSKATIALAESKRLIERGAESAPVATPAVPSSSKVFHISNRLPLGTRWNMKLIAIVGVSLLIAGGSAVGAYVYWSGGAKPKPIPQQVKTPETSTVILQGSEQRAGILGAIQKTIQATSVPQNEIRVIPITRKGTALTTNELFTLLETDAPQTLVRALGKNPTLGVHGFKGGQPFLLFSVSSYDYAFGGMLTWEQTLLADIGPLFGVLPREILRTVGSTTKEALGNTIVIKDVIIKNKDARAAFAPDGSIVFLYSFIDKQTLVFTTSEDTLRMLESRAGGGKLR